MKKILNNHGESLIEVLVSLLIVALCILMLQGSIVTAAKINNKTKSHIEPFLKNGTRVGDKLDITLTDNNGNIIGELSGKVSAEIFKSEGGYYFYE
mgnify:FL=1